MDHGLDTVQSLSQQLAATITLACIILTLSRFYQVTSSGPRFGQRAVWQAENWAEMKNAVTYWSTSQYWPKYAPVIINGIMYSTHFVETTGYSNGILATNLFTGKDLWTINTTNALRCGMVTEWKTVNAYGAIGPYIWTTGTLPAADTGGRLIAKVQVVASPFMNTTGTQWNMYSALTGQYVLSVVNGTNPTLTTDEHGNMIGYYINSTNSVTPQTMTLYGNAPANQAVPKTGIITFKQYNPVLVAWNMSQLFANTWGWSPALNTVIDFGLGVMRATPVFNSTGAGAPTIGVGTNNPNLAINGITNGAVMMTTGFTFNQGFGGTTNGFLIVASMDANTGAQLWIKNFTSTDTISLLPYTRTQMQIQDGLWINANMGNWAVAAYDARTGAQKWTYTLKGFNGAEPNPYDQFNLKTYNGPGCIYIHGFGGDIWSINDQTGQLNWYTNTTALIGDPGIETPYSIWPLWTFSCAAMTNDVAYFAIGHEYNPPLFHGAQLLALNATDGKLVWSTLDMSIESTSISHGILLSRNAYDNQIYAMGKGPTSTTVTAPNIGVTTATPITITGTVMDVSAGTTQSAVAKNFPNGLPAVSDESQSHWMEHVYQQQPFPAGTTGVPVTLSVIDSNNNFRTIATTTTDASGTYAVTWTPDISGNYTVIAAFAGSNSYYGSTAENHFYASNPAATSAPTATAVTGLATTSDVMYIGVAIIVVIIIIGAVLAVLMMRKRP